MSAACGKEALKQKDLQKCLACERGVMHDRAMTFQRITVERYLVMTNTVREQAGLEMMLGPAAALAQVMGPDKDMAKRIGPGDTATICDSCLRLSLHELLEIIGAANDERALQELDATQMPEGEAEAAS